MNSGYLLLVEDDPMVQANNKKILERRGYQTRQALTLAEARSAIAAEMPRAVILDIQLPDGSGLEFLREIRKTSTVPMLMLTALGTPADVVRGLEAGGDAYLPKPYDIGVFLSHLEALLRRASTMPDALVFGPFKLVFASNAAYLNGENMLLAQKEFALFRQFIQNRDKTLNAGYLYEKVWGQPMADDTRALGGAVSRLRAKLKGSGCTITADYGNGYRLERGEP